MTDKTDALMALQNMKANGFDLGLENEDYLALDAAIEALAAPAEGDGAVYQWREFAGRWEDFTKEQFDEVQSSGEIVLGETIITPAMTRKLYTRPAATAQVADDRYECRCDQCGAPLSLPPHCAAPAAPRSEVDESKELLDAKVIDSLIVANEEWQAVAAKLAACLSDAIAGECPIPLFHASSAALQGYAALATGEQP